MSLSKIAVSGGGTGGHFFPALALIEYCHEKNIETIYIGNRQGIEEKFKQILKGKSIFLDMKGFVGKNFFERIDSLFLTLKNTLILNRYINENIPSIIFGGYTGLPLGIHSILKRKHLFIHEQNSVPGKTNLYLSKYTKCVFYTFEYTNKFFKSDCLIKTGIPLRKIVKEGIGIKKQTALKQLDLEDRPTILFMGGSQGALFINRLAIEIMHKLKNFQGILLCGEKLFKDVSSMAKDKVSNLKIFPFYKNMPFIYRASDVAVCRAGAGTISELSYYGLPALFIPYPYASGDHQYYNAKEIEDLGGGKVIRQENVDVELVVKTIEKILSDKLSYSKSIQKFFPKNPEATIVNIIKDYII